MLKRLSTWLINNNPTWLMIASLALMVVFMIFVLPDQAEKSSLASGTDRSPDTSFFYTPAELYQLAEDYGLGGRQAYIQARWTFDLAFPLVYTIFLTSGISWFIHRLSGWAESWKLANLLPVLGGLFDLLENSASTLAMSLYPAKAQIPLIAASVFTPIKWALVSASFIPYLLFGAAWLIQQGKNSKA